LVDFHLRVAPILLIYCLWVYVKIIPGNKDPCIDDTTPFYEHHILGTLQEFREQTGKNLQSKVKYWLVFL
jgi:hypothetical protein